MEIGSDIVGQFQGATVRLTKQHRGKYSNSVKYEAQIMQDTRTGLFVLRGRYDHGVFELQQICPDVRKQ